MLNFLRSRPAPPREQLLAAIVLRNTAVGERESAGRLTLTAPLRRSTLAKFFASSTPAQRSFELDALGAFVWRIIDNRKTVEQLIRHFASEKRVSLREAEIAILAFLKTLTHRGLIALAPPSQQQTPTPK